MNNLHRELAPISDEAWGEIEQETTRTLKRYLAGRRVVDVTGPGGHGNVGGRHRAPRPDRPADAPACRPGSARCCRSWNCGCRSRWAASRSTTWRAGREDSDWQPAKDAARQIAFAEDQAIFAGYAAAGIGGIAPGASNPPLILPAEVADYPMAFAQAAGQLRAAGVDGPVHRGAVRRGLHSRQRGQRSRLPDHPAPAQRARRRARSGRRRSPARSC